MVLKDVAVGQFCTEFQMSLYDIFVWLWINPETSLCETYVILGPFLHKNDPILLSMLQNVNKALLS